MNILIIFKLFLISKSYIRCTDKSIISDDMNMLPVLSLRSLNIDPNNFRVRSENKNICLTKKEFQLLEFMAMNRDRVLNRITILEHVWQYGTFSVTNTLDAHIGSLRRKLDKGRRKKLIRTIHGIGFLFSDA